MDTLGISLLAENGTVESGKAGQDITMKELGP